MTKLLIISAIVLLGVVVTANGLSSSHLIKNNEGIEDKQKSRRVEFRTKTNAEKKVVEIIERMEEI